MSEGRREAREGQEGREGGKDGEWRGLAGSLSSIIWLCFIPSFANTCIFFLPCQGESL